MTQDIPLLHCQNFAVIEMQVASADCGSGDLEDDVILTGEGESDWDSPENYI